MKATPDELKRYASICTNGMCSKQCPYYEIENCIKTLILNMLAYIEQLESRAEPKNRVLTLEEVSAHCAEGADAAPLWYERKDHSNVNRWMVIDLPELAFGSTATVKRLVNSPFFEPTYGEKWRCWLRKPTEEEREGTPWAGDSRE